MKDKNVLVLGGKGKTGRKVAEKLGEKGISYRIGSRKGTPPFDWEDSSTWEGALQGVSKVYVTFQPDLAVPGAPDIINKFTETAVKLGIEHLVLLSGRGEKEAELCENMVMNAGTGWTIVRSDWFNQNFSEDFFLEPVLQGMVALPVRDVGVPFVDTDDIANVVVASLLDEKHIGKVYELTGPRLLTFQEAIQEISDASGRSIQFQSVAISDYTAILRENKVPEGFIWLMQYLFTEVLDGRNSSVTDDIEKVLGRKPKDFREYAQQASDVWRPVSTIH